MRLHQSNTREDRRSTDVCWGPALCQMEVLGAQGFNCSQLPGQKLHFLAIILSILFSPSLRQTGAFSPPQDSVLLGSGGKLDQMNERPSHSWGYLREAVPGPHFKLHPPSPVKVLRCNRSQHRLISEEKESIKCLTDPENAGEAASEAAEPGSLHNDIPDWERCHWCP